jgi:LDH2 family malate/lactate/ureidoglycolate dehydrogenase
VSGRSGLAAAAGAAMDSRIVQMNPMTLKRLTDPSQFALYGLTNFMIEYDWSDCQAGRAILGSRSMSSLQAFSADDLIAFAHSLLRASGLPADRARVVAEILVEGDLMGHTTHGLQLLPLHLDAIERGVIARNGEPAIIADHGSAFTWDGNWLPGPWLMREALALASERIVEHPVVTIVLRRSGHIGCLAAYPRFAIERGLAMLLTCSDPSIASVAPHGAVEGRFTPNPIAAGWPTEDEPVIVDVCPSTTTNGMAARLARNGQRLPGPWLIDPEGNLTDDPAVLFGDPKGAVLPLGGDELGHKGFALALIVEMMTASLGGFGRADMTGHWGASVFIQIIDPAKFGGSAAFLREGTALAQSCRSAKPRPGKSGVRMPGERAQADRRRQLQEGVNMRTSSRCWSLGHASSQSRCRPPRQIRGETDANPGRERKPPLSAGRRPDREPDPDRKICHRHTPAARAGPRDTLRRKPSDGARSAGRPGNREPDRGPRRLGRLCVSAK